MNLHNEILNLKYKNGLRDSIQRLFLGSSGLCWIKHEDNPKSVVPIYISCDEIGFNNHCCLNCQGDNHAGDYDDSQGRMERRYVESRHGLIIFYCCCEHQDVENLLKVLDKHIEKNK